MSFADEQLITAAAKLAEATSDSEEYQRALYHYTQLVRHRMANPLHIIGGAAATLQAQPELSSVDRGVLLDEIYKQAKILERVCLEPKIMHPSELDLSPRPVVPVREEADGPGHISDGPPHVVPLSPRGIGGMDPQT
jgi:signal transduction histidine kinase